MSNKLKITEGQLKKLMERKHSYIDNSANIEVEEVDIIVNSESEVEESDNVEYNKKEESKDEMINESLKSIKENFKRFF